VVSESIKKRSGELFVAGEDRDPFGKRQIGRDDDASPLVAFREEVEEELAAAAIERYEAELVDLCGTPHYCCLTISQRCGARRHGGAGG